MSMDMSMEVGRMVALAEAVQREAERAEPEIGGHAIWLIDLLNADLNHLKSRIDNGDYDGETPQAELDLIGGAS